MYTWKTGNLYKYKERNNQLQTALIQLLVNAFLTQPIKSLITE